MMVYIVWYKNFNTAQPYIRSHKEFILMPIIFEIAVYFVMHDCSVRVIYNSFIFLMLLLEYIIISWSYWSLLHIKLTKYEFIVFLDTKLLQIHVINNYKIVVMLGCNGCSIVALGCNGCSSSTVGPPLSEQLCAISIQDLFR